MNEHLDQNTQSTQPTNEDLEVPKVSFPPPLSTWESRIRIISILLGFVALLYLCNQFCRLVGSHSICGTYIAFGLVLIPVFIEVIFRHRFFVYKARREDQSMVEAIFVEAETVEPRETEQTEDFKIKKTNLKAEVQRLKRLGHEHWTEYQVLSLNQLLVDFLNVDELIARARMNLAELEDYAQSTAYRYDADQYLERKAQITRAIDEIDKIPTDSDGSSSDSEAEREGSSEKLRSELRTLLDYVAGYHMNWSEGSAVIRGIMICGVATIPILLAMGLLRILHPAGDDSMGIFNWGLLGMSGSLSAVLSSLHNSDLVEVGNTEGKKELWRAVLGATLGLVAGILTYSMIEGGIISGPIFPNPPLLFVGWKDLALSVFWAIAAGFSFELVFERLRSATVAAK